MQIQSLRLRAYRSWCVDDSTPPEAVERLKKLETILVLREESCSLETALSVVAWSRATFYRWYARFRDHGLAGLIARSRRPHRSRPREWTKAQEQAVWHLRRRFPSWGKVTLWKILSRDHGLTLSCSTVGRILAKGVRLGRVVPCAFYYGRVKNKRQRRLSDRYAKRWRYRMKAGQPGELVQIDHMSVSLALEHEVKEFTAVCPVFKQMVIKAYRRATALNARDFLRTVIGSLPFPLRSIQVDGGSEFMAEFEAACAEFEIPLYVLPPKRPQYNGCVERANGTSRAEFYPFYDGPLTIKAINRALLEYQRLYNDYRPHRSLDLMTLNEYLRMRTAA
ncbi:MAG: helix-turn-helix domain-containing protein [Phycisphaerales bacterium JB058]